MLPLNRPIVFYDVETTGLNVACDRIVSISIVKVMSNGKTEGKAATINPQIPIPKAASNVHGITDDMVKDLPPFKKLAKGIYAFIDGCDIAGYNNTNFDNIILSEEFSRCGLTFPQPNTLNIDVCTIFKKMEQRTLEAAYQFYCGKQLTNAHTSNADAIATLHVFEEQIKKYPELQGKTLEEIAQFCALDNRADLAGKIITDEHGNHLYSFGKHKGQKVLDEPTYAQWMLAGDFASNTKYVLTQILIKGGVIADDDDNKSLF